MKKILVLTLALMLALSCAGALAEAGEALTYAQLAQCAQTLLDSLSSYTLQNEPAETYDPSGDGAYLYDYGAIQLTMTGTQVTLENVRQIEIVDDTVPGPGGVRVGDAMNTLLTAFQCNNPALTGDTGFATLYVNEVYDVLEAPEYDWAWVLRSGETAYGVQYACSLPQENGAYRDAGALFILTDGRVSAIRLYGFGDVITAQEAQMNFDTAREIQMRNDFTPENTLLAEANTHSALTQDELQVNGNALLELDEAALCAILGAPEAAGEMEDETGALQRTLSFAGMEVTLNADGTAQQIVLTADTAAGPRGLRVGMDVREALSLLRADAPVYKGENATLYLEGEAGDDPPYAYMDFFADGRAAIRVGVRLAGETNRFAMLYVDLAENQIEEIRIYTYTM